MRYKFSLNPKIKGYVAGQLEHYKEDKKQLEEYKNDMIPSAVQQLSWTSGVSGGSVSNPTEQIGLKIATSQYILPTERSIRAIEKVLGLCEEADLKLIYMVSWKQSYTIEGAALKLHYSPRTGYRRINNVLCMVALELGLVSV